MFFRCYVTLCSYLDRCKRFREAGKRWDHLDAKDVAFRRAFSAALRARLKSLVILPTYAP
jgi:hypothetical protein